MGETRRELTVGTVASVARFVIAALLGWLAVDVAPEKIGDVATAVGVLVVFGLSIWSSVAEKRRHRAALPPGISSGKDRAS